MTLQFKKMAEFDIYVFIISLGRYCCWWTISPRGYIYPVVSASVLKWLIIYTMYLLLTFTVPKSYNYY